MTKIAIVTGSVRPGRFNIQPAKWFYELAKKRSDMKVEFIDVADLNLPFMDEPVPPMMHQYSKDHTKAWSKQIDGVDGFVFVTPEYNHSVSPVLKNAVDYLNHEWNFKPISFISYGSEAGGARAVEHWRGIAGELKMFDLREQLLFNSYWERMDDKGSYKFTESDERHAQRILDDTLFWAEAMKSARKKLKK